MNVSAPVALIILDGWGDAAPGPGNAISLAKMPNLDGLVARFPHTLLRTSGESVGLPDGQMGNSEVGHLNLGAGRIVYQELTRISRSIRTGDFFHNPVLLGFCEQLRNNTGALHVLGLVSDERSARSGAGCVGRAGRGRRGEEARRGALAGRGADGGSRGLRTQGRG